MGRRGSKIIPFLMKALETDRYKNLKWEDRDKYVFSLSLPWKTKKLDAEIEQILKDYRAFKNQPYGGYTKAKQAFEAALKKSVFLEKIPTTCADTLMYRVLKGNEVREKRFQKAKTTYVEYSNPPSVNSSGYGSGEDFPAIALSEIKEEDLEKMYGVENVTILSSSIYDSAENFLVSTSLQTVKDLAWKHDVENVTIPFSDNPSTFLSAASCVNPNDVLYDPRSTQSSEFHHPTYGNEAMEIDDSEHVFSLNEQNDNPISTEMDDSAFNAIFERNRDAITENFPDSLDTAAWESFIDSTEEGEDALNTSSSAISSNDENLEIFKESDVQEYHFKESRTSNDEEIWVFTPEVSEIRSDNGNENDSSSSGKYVAYEKFKRMHSIEVNWSNNQISVCLKRKDL